jgi:hypothetical protein
MNNLIGNFEMIFQSMVRGIISINNSSRELCEMLIGIDDSISAEHMSFGKNEIVRVYEDEELILEFKIQPYNKYFNVKITPYNNNHNTQSIHMSILDCIAQSNMVAKSYEMFLNSEKESEEDVESKEDFKDVLSEEIMAVRASRENIERIIKNISKEIENSDRAEKESESEEESEDEWI